MNMDFDANKTRTEVIKEGALEQLILETFILVLNGKWYKLWKEFDELKNIDQNYYCSNIIMPVLINMVLNVKHH